MFTKIQNKRVILPVVLVAVIIGSGAFLWLNQPTDSEAAFVLVQNYLDQEKTIQYIGNVDDAGVPFGVVMYDTSSLESLKQYAKASRLQGQSLIDAGVNEFYVWVTFNYPLTTTAFETLAQQTGLDVKRYTMRAIGQKGDRITISGGPENGQIIPVDQFEDALNSIQGHENNQAQFKGIFEVLGVVSVEGYQALVRDPQVFLVDVTGTLIYHDQNFQRKTRLSWQEFVAGFQMGSSGPFWYLEDYGLDTSGR